MALRLMHIDDEPDIREVTGIALALDPDLEVTAVASGAAALARLKGGERPDAILLDVTLPRLDGPGVLGQLRTIEGLEHTPVIFMTARAADSEIRRLTALGAAGVILKPFDPLTLAQDVRRLISTAVLEGPLP